jgi:hypothetical protein
MPFPEVSRYHTKPLRNVEPAGSRTGLPGTFPLQGVADLIRCLEFEGGQGRRFQVPQPLCLALGRGLDPPPGCLHLTQHGVPGGWPAGRRLLQDRDGHGDGDAGQHAAWVGVRDAADPLGVGGHGRAVVPRQAADDGGSHNGAVAREPATTLFPDGAGRGPRVGAEVGRKRQREPYSRSLRRSSPPVRGTPRSPSGAAAGRTAGDRSARPRSPGRRPEYKGAGPYHPSSRRASSACYGSSSGCSETGSTLRRRPPAPQARTGTPSPVRRRLRGPVRKCILGPGPPTALVPGVAIPGRVDLARGPGEHRGWTQTGPAGGRTWLRERSGMLPTSPRARRRLRTGNTERRGSRRSAPGRGRRSRHGLACARGTRAAKVCSRGMSRSRTVA